MSRRILGLLIIMGALAMAVTDAMAGTADSDNVHYSRTDSIMICRLLAEAETVPDTENIPLFFRKEVFGTALCCPYSRNIRQGASCRKHV